MGPEFITINTEQAATQVTEQRRLDVYDERNPLLGQKIPEYVENIPNPTLTSFINDLRDAKKRYGGIGLAANQCGYPVRAFIIGGDFRGMSLVEMVCINPKILKYSPNVEKFKEGCLSYPGLFINISRPSMIEVEYTNEYGEIKVETLSGITARCFQHELDHLEGIKFTDRVGKLALSMAKEKRKKLIKKIQRGQFQR
jgi:peptide deformylase